MSEEKVTITPEEFRKEHADEIKEKKAKEMVNIVAKEEAKKELVKQEEYEEALKRKRDQKRTERSTYDVRGVNFANDKDMQRAIQEMINYQDRYCLHMADLENQEINYKVLGDDDRQKQAELSRRLKSYNDAYTMSMLSSCYTPLSEGVTIGTLLQASFNMKSLEAMNPSLNMDKSRFYDNLRKELLPIVDKNPMLKPLRPAIEKMNETMQYKSTDAMNEAISDKLKENDFDSLVMTPRQIAILKVNFMEQYYVDMRAQDPNSDTYHDDMKKLGNQYEHAVKHLQAVAENSGFDMSVVAAEERYFVGLKMRANPDAHYENVFNETYSIYGASMDMRQLSGDIQWEGKFLSADEHDFNARIGDYNGSFTVRAPIVTEDQKNNFIDGLKRQGQQYAWMMQYLDSDVCPCKDDVKQSAKELLTRSYDAYKERAARITMDDWNYSEKDAKKFIEDTFTASANMEFELGKEIPFNEVKNQFATDVGIATGKDFYNELKYVVEKQAFDSINIDITAKPSTRNEKIDEFTKKAKAYYENLNETDNRSNEQVAEDLVNNWVESLNAYELQKLMFHVGANMEQGIKSHGSVSRNNAPTVQDEYANIIDSKDGDGVSKFNMSDLTEREIPDYDDVESDPYSGYDDV